MAVDHSKSYLEPDSISMLKEFKEGKPIGESGRIEHLSDQFSWKRSFVNCWTGRPNFGKSTFLQFMAVNKSKHDNWKWCIWSPEMISSDKGKDGKVYKTATDIYDELIHIYTGENPYKHFKDRYGISQMSEERYLEAITWVQDRFFVVEPKDKRYKHLIDNYMYMYETYGIDGWIIDPFRSVRYDQLGGTLDYVLSQIFDEFKEAAILTNSSVNFIAHPKGDNDPFKRGKDGIITGYKPVNQYNLLGGSAWDNAMDGIFSVHRPYKHLDDNDPATYLYHHKQRKKHLVGDTGVYKKIEYNPKTNRYYFDGHCPIDGSFKQPLIRDDKGAPLPNQPQPPDRGLGKPQEIVFEKTDEQLDDAPF